MIYNYNGKNVTIPDAEIDKLVSALEISQEEAIETWLMDNDMMEDEEADRMGEQAKVNKLGADAAKGHKKTNAKPRTVKISDEKKELFEALKRFLADNYGADATVVKENKEFAVVVGEKKFKIDLVEHRPPKKK